jgi:hypothetical protein
VGSLRAGSRTASGLPPGQGLDRVSALPQLVEEQDAVVPQCSGMSPEETRAIPTPGR